MNEWSGGLDGQRCVGRQCATKKKWSDIWLMNASLIFISEINRHIPTPPTITMTSNDIAAQFVISHFIIIIINEWMNEWMNEWRDWMVINMMMKKSVLHLIADDRYCRFEETEEAQFEMLLSLISDYHVDEEITTADHHGNHVRYLFLIILLIIIIIDHDSYL